MYLKRKIPANVKIYTGVNATLRDAVESYKAGKYEAVSQPNVQAHHGMGGGMSGGGMGRGMGRGMGGGMMQGSGAVAQQPDSAQGLEDLKAQSEMLAQQLAEIQKRIEGFGKKAE